MDGRFTIYFITVVAIQRNIFFIYFFLREREIRLTGAMDEKRLDDD